MHQYLDMIYLKLSNRELTLNIFNTQLFGISPGRYLVPIQAHTGIRV